MVVLRYFLLVVSVGFYFYSLSMNGIGADYFAVDVKKYEIESGLLILLSGWMGVLVGLVAWYANIFYFASLITFAFSKRFSLYFAIAAVIIAATMFFPQYELTYYTGAYIWFLSLIILLLAGLSNYWGKKTSVKQ